MNDIKTKLHNALFPAVAAKLAMQAEMLAKEAVARTEEARFSERLADELDQTYQAKVQAWVDIGHYKTRLQAAEMVDGIQKKVIVHLNDKLAQADAAARKWKAAAIELEEELKTSFFEIATLNKLLDDVRSGAESGARDGAQDDPAPLLLVHSA